MANPTRIQRLEEQAAENNRRQLERRRDLRLRLADLVLKAIGQDPDLQRLVAALVAALPHDDRGEIQHAFPKLKPPRSRACAPTPATTSPPGSCR